MSQRLSLWLVLPLCLAACAPVSAQQQRKLALLVGVREYRHAALEKLRYTENDVVELAPLLRAAGFQTTLLCDGEGAKHAGSRPTKANFDTALKALLKDIGRDDVVLVALAGHGLQPEGAAESYFCPSDANPTIDKGTGDRASKAAYPETLVSIGGLLKQLDESGAGRRFLLVDACRDDSSGRGRSGIADLLGYSGQTSVLLSCSKGQRAFEPDELRHGVFFYSVIQGLKGEAKDRKGRITWDDLRKYVRDEVPGLLPKSYRDKGARQTPQAFGTEIGEPYVIIAAQSAPAPQGDYAEFIRAWMTVGLSKTFVEKQPASRVAEWRAKAEASDSEAQLMLASCCFWGGGQPRSYDEYVKWCRKSADLGNAFGMAEAGWSYIALRNPQPNAEEALKWFRKAADKRNPIGIAGLGYLYATGKGVPKDYDRGMKYFLEASEMGYVQAMVEVGALYASGKGVSKDYAEALQWYRKAAALGNAAAMNQIGVMYAGGKGLSHDGGQAFQWCSKAAQLGYPMAMNNLGNLYQDGVGVSQDYSEALKWYHKAAGFDNPFAMNAIGFTYWRGRGVAKNGDEALKWFLKAVELRDSTAANNIGMMCVDASDYERAVRWLRLAIEYDEQNGLAISNLAYRYDNGEGVPKNVEEANQLFRRAAALGDKQAIAALRKRGIEP